jgi:hypothetical protein
MQRHEYKIFWLGQHVTPGGQADTEAMLNGLGDQGWEMVWGSDDLSHVLMGRQKPEPATDAPDSRTT